MTTKFGAFLTKRREAIGLTYTQVAAACGVSEACVRCWEAGEYRPRSARMGRLARCLKVRKSVLENSGDAGSLVVD